MLAFLVFLLLHRHLPDSLQSSLVSLLIPFRVHPPLLTPFTLSAAFLTLPQTTDVQFPPRTFFFLKHMKNSFLLFPPLLSSALLHATYSGSHLQTTLECYLYCPGLGSCYSFPLLTKDVCSDLNFTKVQGWLESGLLA